MERAVLEGIDVCQQLVVGHVNSSFHIHILFHSLGGVVNVEVDIETGQCGETCTEGDIVSQRHGCFKTPTCRSHFGTYCQVVEQFLVLGMSIRCQQHGGNKSQQLEDSSHKLLVLRLLFLFSFSLSGSRSKEDLNFSFANICKMPALFQIISLLFLFS